MVAPCPEATHTIVTRHGRRDANRHGPSVGESPVPSRPCDPTGNSGNPLLIRGHHTQIQGHHTHVVDANARPPTAPLAASVSSSGWRRSSAARCARVHPDFSGDRDLPPGFQPAPVVSLAFSASAVRVAVICVNLYSGCCGCCCSTILADPLRLGGELCPCRCGGRIRVPLAPSCGYSCCSLRCTGRCCSATEHRMHPPRPGKPGRKRQVDEN